MDVTKALALLAVAGGMIELAKALLPDNLSRNPRVLTGLCILAGFAATFLVRYSVWSKEQVIGDTTLDKLSTGSLIVVAIAVAGAEATAYLVLKRTGQSVANIGQNQPLPLAEVIRHVESVPDVHDAAPKLMRPPAEPLEHPDYVFDA